MILIFDLFARARVCVCVCACVEQADVGVVRAAVSQNGLALQYASQPLRASHAIVLAGMCGCVLVRMAGCTCCVRFHARLRVELRLPRASACARACVRARVQLHTMCRSVAVLDCMAWRWW